MRAKETSWTESKLCSKQQNKKTNKKQQRIPYSLKPYSKNIKQKHEQNEKEEE